MYTSILYKRRRACCWLVHWVVIGSSNDELRSVRQRAQPSQSGLSTMQFAGGDEKKGNECAAHPVFLPTLIGKQGMFSAPTLLCRWLMTPFSSFYLIVLLTWPRLQILFHSYSPLELDQNDTPPFSYCMYHIFRTFGKDGFYSFYYVNPPECSLKCTWLLSSSAINT